MPGRLMLAGLAGFLMLLSGCHHAVRPAEDVSIQQRSEPDEQMAVLAALGAEMAREKHPRSVVVRGTFLGPEDRSQGPPPVRFEQMRPVEPAIMSFALAAGALVDISPGSSKRWLSAYFEGPGKHEANPGEAAQPVAMFHQMLDPPVIRGDSASVDVWERVLRAGRPDETQLESWRYSIRRQNPGNPWIVTGRVLVWAQ